MRRVTEADNGANLRLHNCAIRFGTLAPLAVWRNGEPVEIGRLRMRKVLAVLLLDAARTVSSARLIDEV